MARSMTNTASVSFRLTPEARRLLRALAEAKGITMTAVLELCIREAARHEGIK